MKKVLASKTEKKSRRSSSGKLPPIPAITTSSGKILFDGKERIFLLKSELEEILGKWPKEVDRMLYASRRGNPWLKIVSNESGKSGAEVRVTAESVLRAAKRITAGERPPLMPSEQKKGSPQPQGLAPGGIPDAVISAFLRAGEMLPAGVTSVEFKQTKKTISVQWENGDFQSIRKKTSRGRATRVITVCFSPPAKDQPPVLRPSRKSDRLEPGQF